MSTLPYPVGTRIRVTLEGVVGNEEQFGCTHITDDHSWNSWIFLGDDSTAKVEVIGPKPKVGDVWEADGIRFLVDADEFFLSQTGFHGKKGAEHFFGVYPNAVRILEGA